MIQIDIKYLERNGRVDYVDDHLAFIGDTANLSAIFSCGKVKTGFVLCIICIQGKLQVSVDAVSQTLARHQALVCPIHSLMDDYLSSPDFQAIAICASPTTFKDFYLNKQMWEYYQFVLRNHVVEFTEVEWGRFARYYGLMQEHLKSLEGRFHRKITHSLWQTVIYEFMTVIDRYVTHVRPSVESVGVELLVQRFMEMLAMSEGRIHTVAEFAARLFVTPKYLSTSVKQITGKTALQWIHESVSKEAERLLCNSGLSVKEISECLKFPNASFFGKFVKAHLGDTPATIQGRSLKPEL